MNIGPPIIEFATPLVESKYMHTVLTTICAQMVEV